MAFRSRRQVRYNNLLSSGFSKTEARNFSKLSSDNPILHDLKIQRKTEIKGLKSDKAVKAKISKLYTDNNWRTLRTNNKLIQKPIADPWKMFRYYEDLYKAKNPDYGARNESKTKDFIDKPYDPTKKRQKK